MKRSRRSADSSLELLLDTICNTFGGVLFLAILVAILLQMTGSPPRDASKSTSDLETLRVNQDLAEAQAEVARLRLVAAQGAEITNRLSRPDQREAYVRLKDTRQRSAELESKRQTAIDQIRRHDAETKRIAAEDARLDQDLQTAEKELATVESARKLEIASRTQTAKLPRVRISVKDEVALMLRGGRLYFTAKRGPSGRLELNTAECIEQQSAAGITVLPKPGAGSEVKLDGSSRIQIAQRFTGTNAQDFYLAVFVWEDSFAQFRELKHVMVAGGFEYKLVPMQPDKDITISSGRPTATEVQ